MVLYVAVLLPFFPSCQQGARWTFEFPLRSCNRLMLLSSRDEVGCRPERKKG